MKSDNPLSNNLFGRVFSYTPREGRLALEDFCTESLAWCLVNSPEFATEFLKMLKLELRNRGKLKTKFAEFDGAPSIATQLSFSLVTGQDENDDEESERIEHKRFDLVIESPVGFEFILVIETKVASDTGADLQLSEYRNALEAHPRFVPFAERYVVSLTPSISGLTSPDANVTWGVVQKLLKDCNVDSSIELIYRQFASFLAERQLGFLTLMKLTPESIRSLNSVAPFFEGAQNLFQRFRNEKSLGSLFKKHAERPWIDSSSDDQSSYYGIGTPWGTFPYFYAGFTFKGKTAALSVEMVVQGNQKRLSKKFPKDLDTAANTATEIYGLSSEEEDGNTYFYFMHRLATEETSQADFLLRWFRVTIESALSVVK